MDSERILIKNMVCDRCILVVRQEFEKLEIPVISVILGEVVAQEHVTKVKKEQLATTLKQLGFELLVDRKLQLVENVKTIVVELIHRHETLPNVNLSDYISTKIGVEYNTISKLFSAMEHTTIEKFIIAQKIERIKELISYNELTLSEIAHRMHYSSLAHLSNQFKKITGYTPSEYKTKHLKQRLPLHDVL